MYIATQLVKAPDKAKRLAIMSALRPINSGIRYEIVNMIAETKLVRKLLLVSILNLFDSNQIVSSPKTFGGSWQGIASIFSSDISTLLFLLFVETHCNASLRLNYLAEAVFRY